MSSLRPFTYVYPWRLTWLNESSPGWTTQPSTWQVTQHPSSLRQFQASQLKPMEQHASPERWWLSHWLRRLSVSLVYIKQGSYYHLPNPPETKYLLTCTFEKKNCQDVGKSKDTNHTESMPNDEPSTYGVVLPVLLPKKRSWVNLNKCCFTRIARAMVFDPPNAPLSLLSYSCPTRVASALKIKQHNIIKFLMFTNSLKCLNLSRSVTVPKGGDLTKTGESFW